MNEDQIYKTDCPVCHSHNDGHQSMSGDDSVPGDGDLSICVYCGTINMYTIKGRVVRLRSLTPEEAKEAMKSPELVRAVQFVRHLTLKGS